MPDDILERFAGNGAVLSMRDDAVLDQGGRSRRVAAVTLALVVGDNDRFDG